MVMDSVLNDSVLICDLSTAVLVKRKGYNRRPKSSKHTAAKGGYQCPHLKYRNTRMVS